MFGAVKDARCTRTAARWSAAIPDRPCTPLQPDGVGTEGVPAINPSSPARVEQKARERGSDGRHGHGRSPGEQEPAGDDPAWTAAVPFPPGLVRRLEVLAAEVGAVAPDAPIVGPVTLGESGTH